MKKFFYTQDHDNTVKEDAHIEVMRCSDFKQFKRKLIDFLADGGASYELEDNETLEVTSLDFGDCWIKSYDPETYPADVSPFRECEINRAGAGSHPGGNCQWITPNRPVYGITVKYNAA